MSEPMLTREQIEEIIEAAETLEHVRLTKENAIALCTLALSSIAMREALKPFAVEARRYDPPEGDNDLKAWSSQFTIGDLRRAAEAYQEQGK